MSDALIVGGLRTPRGKGSPKGALHGLKPVELVAQLLGNLADEVGRNLADEVGRNLADEVGGNLADGSHVDDLILGCATQTDAQGGNLARTAALFAGWSVPGLTINRFCASGLDAVSLAAARVRSGDASLVVAGGVESVSRVPAFADRGPLYADPVVAARTGAVHMGIAADLIATLDGVTREALDDYGERTRAKARAAPRSPALRPTGGLDHDELLDGAPLDPAALPPLFADRPEEDTIARARYPEAGPLQHLHTRASSPALADAAALLVIADRATAARHHLPVRARIVASATCAVDPVIMLTAGQLAAERALERAGIAAREVAVFEVAEAFAATCLRFMRALDVDHDRLNPHGGTMALGHAFGATGAILALNVVEHLERLGARYGVAAVSGAAGLGSAMVIERV